jgi:hypothetical protein
VDNMVRVTALKGSKGSEKALILRLHFLQVSEHRDAVAGSGRDGSDGISQVG